VRLLRLCPDQTYREIVRLEVAPAAVAQDVRRARELLAEGHLHAALTLAEKILAFGRRVPKLRALQHDVVKAVVSRAHAAQTAGDAALRKGDAVGAKERYEEALELLEDDRVLLARLEQAQAATPAAMPKGRPGPARGG
jgi:predicted negative regulator of RcsB-dependent stress response